MQLRQICLGLPQESCAVRGEARRPQTWSCPWETRGSLREESPAARGDSQSRGCGTTGTSYTVGEGKWCSCCGRQCGVPARKLKIYRTALWSSNPPSGYIPLNWNQGLRDLRTPMFTETLFVIAKKWRRPKFPLMDEQRKCGMYIQRNSVQPYKRGFICNMWPDEWILKTSCWGNKPVTEGQTVRESTHRRHLNQPNSQKQGIEWPGFGDRRNGELFNWYKVLVM